MRNEYLRTYTVNQALLYRAGELTDGRHDNARLFVGIISIIMCSVYFCSPARLYKQPRLNILSELLARANTAFLCILS